MTDSAGLARPITAAFDDPADARRARLAATRLAPVRLDCDGHPGPGLADRWSADTSARFWTLELGARLSASPEERARWTASALAATWRADPDADLALRAAGVESVLPLDDRRLVVGFAAPERQLPAVFAARALSVAVGDSTTLLEHEPGTGDLRDAIDNGTDLVQTGDPDLLDYAGRRPGLTRAALPWNRLYLLLLPDGGVGLDAAIPADTSAFRAELAQNAVRTDARPAPTSSWADSASRCLGAAGATQHASSNAVVYPLADGTARELAERIVALARGAGLVARPLGPDTYTIALRRGDGRAFIVSGPRVTAGPCAESSGWPAATVIPLVETRRHVVVRRGAPPLMVEADGAVRVAEPGDTAGAGP